MTDDEKALAAAAPPTQAFPQPLPEPTDEGRKTIREFVASGRVTIVAMESCTYTYAHIHMHTSYAQLAIYICTGDDRRDGIM